MKTAGKTFTAPEKFTDTKIGDTVYFTFREGVGES